MDSVIVSIHPEWWPKIKSGEKWLEIRKNIPLMIGRMPFSIIWYVTGGVGCVGASLCSGFFKEEPDYSRLVTGSCLTQEQLAAYGDGKPLYGWRIEETNEYKKPIPLSKFGLERPPQSWQYYSIGRDEDYT